MEYVHASKSPSLYLHVHITNSTLHALNTFFLLFSLILFWLYDVCLFTHMCCVLVGMWCIWLNPKSVALCKTKSDLNYFSMPHCFLKTKSNLNYFSKTHCFLKTKSDLNYFSKSHCFLKQNQIWIIFQILIIFLNQKSDLNQFSILHYFLKPKSKSEIILKISFVLQNHKSDLNFILKIHSFLLWKIRFAISFKTHYFS